jgi:hypothetical protein
VRRRKTTKTVNHDFRFPDWFETGISRIRWRGLTVQQPCWLLRTERERNTSSEIINNS